MAIHCISHDASSASATAAVQLQLPIFDPLEPRILPQNSAALFTVNWLSPTGQLNRQRAFNVDEMETVLRLTAGQPNMYMSQCLLDRPVRRHPFIWYLTHAYTDLDTYRIPALAGRSQDDLVRDIRRYCDDTGTPQPSAIIGSGRGMYCKWYWTNPVGRSEVGRMVGVNRALVRRLAHFGADPKATDATRVLRITGSEHRAAGRLVELLHLDQRDGRTITYDADAFAREVAPTVSVEPVADPGLSSVTGLQRGNCRSRNGHVFTREGWHWAIVEDCRLLAGMRWGGMVPQGWRDIFGHVMACQLARIFSADVLHREIMAHARLILPADYVMRDLRGHCSSLLKRAAQHQHYRYRKTTIIQSLQITPAEERHMRALISDEEGRRRNTERHREQRRATGMIEREAWLAKNSAAREQPWKAKGISRATWYRRDMAT